MVNEFPELKKELFKAYFRARKNKRNTKSQLKFELNFEQSLHELADEIDRGEYRPLPTKVFLVHYPVSREVFAAQFRDRVVHHWIFTWLNPIVEKKLIYDCFSCRKNKGTHFGVNRVQSFMKKMKGLVPGNAYIMKLDIRSYFMSINKEILWQQIEILLWRYYSKNRPKPLFYNKYVEILKIIVFNDCKTNCVSFVKSSEFLLLPKEKSLFHSDENSGLPIGNLTSQLFGNLYLSDFDLFIKKKLKVAFYGRYVDDMVFIGATKFEMLRVKKEVENYLTQHLNLSVHSKKMQLQPIELGVVFLGYKIYSTHLLPGKRVVCQFNKMCHSKDLLINKDQEVSRLFLNQFNSYSGTLLKAKSYTIRKKAIDFLAGKESFNLCFMHKNYRKIVLKQEKRIFN